MQWRGKTIDRLEVSFKSGAIEGLEYNTLDCCLPDHAARHGKIYTPSQARQLTFGTDCRCDLLPFNSSWGNPSKTYSEPINVKRSRIKKEYEQFLNRDDLDALIALKGLYSQDLQWHWAEFRGFAEKLLRAGDPDSALTWMNASINGRMVQRESEYDNSQYDSSLASLYVAKGIIFMRRNDYIFALLEFLTATWQYEWKPTKTLTANIARALKKLDASEDIFSGALNIARAEGLDNGLFFLQDKLSNNKIEGVRANESN